MQSRNEKCDCGSGKKFKSCCMENSENSFIKRYGYKIALIIFASFFIMTLYNKVVNAEPTVWCYECQKYVPEDSTGHQLEPSSE